MSTPKHTPGPWTAQKERFGKNGIFQEINIRGPVVLEESGHTFNPNFVATINNEANANLIAAAPEMLEALERAEVMLLSSKDAQSDFILTLIQPAIKKARGES